MRFLILFLIGTAVFGACWQFTAIGFILSSVAGMAAMMLSGFLMKIVDRARRGREEAADTPQKAASQIVAEGMEKLRQISNAARMIQSNEVAGKIRAICKVGVEIFDDIKKKPDDARRARQFTGYYLDATKKIVEQYVELSGKKDRSPEVGKALEKIEGMLDAIKATFDRQLAGLLENDLLDLNAEINVLKNTMKMEG
jgi:5-bromo-4-chloroindolyl phosphate hydrolysis protein